MRFILTVFILSWNFCYSQIGEKDFKINPLISTYYANTLSVHPFGLHISRVNNNFQVKADERMSITTNISSGNVWLPYVKAYAPINESDRINMQNVVWHKRNLNFEAEKTPSNTYELQMDGVIRSYQINFNLPLSDNHEIKVNGRCFSIDQGKMPYSIITNDQFIELFHTNIAGGEDPFGRKHYGFNNVNFFYKDAEGRSFQVNDGDFIFAGIDFSYYYYPSFGFLKKRNIFSNIGIQMGVNSNKVNPSVDIGVNFGLTKKMKLSNNKNILSAGISLGALRQKLLYLEGVELSNKVFLLSSEMLLEYVRHFNKEQYLSIGTNWFFQSSYRKRSDMDYLVLTGNRISSHWHYAISHLHRSLSANSLVLTYGRSNTAFWVYLRNDLLVDNAPDIQTGIGIKSFLKWNYK